MNTEIQYGIIGDFINPDLNADLVFQIAEQNRLRPEHFTDGDMRAAYEAILALDSQDVALIRDELSRRIGVNAIEKAIRLGNNLILDFFSFPRAYIIMRGMKKPSSDHGKPNCCPLTEFFISLAEIGTPHLGGQSHSSQ